MKTLRTIQSILILFLLFTGFSLQCGPGNRSGGRRQKSRKMTPLVYKEHVPNISENTLGASGLPDGAITRGDARFKDLVENHNTDIIFRDEERDGSDRLMSERCKEKLNILAILVQNQWPGNPPETPPVKLKVKEAWDDNYLHGENSLHYEGRAVDVATNDRDRSKLGMLARLAVEAGFDWVFYESHGHIHCSVKSDSSAAIKTGGCFPGTVMVQSETMGYIPMSDLRTGDRVMSMSGSGTLEYSDVMTFMDRDDNGYGLFYTLHTESGKYLTLTAKHLLYVAKNNSTFLDINDSEAVFADSIVLGQYLILGEKTSFSLSKVIKIIVDTRKGIYAPLTKHGTIVVNGVVASCYAYINIVSVAHLVFAPMRAYHDISQYLPSFRWTETDSAVISNNSNTQTGMHWYARVLYSIGTSVLSKDTLYVH